MASLKNTIVLGCFILAGFGFQTWMQIEHQEHGIALLTINRPKALNALNQQLLHELEEVVCGLEKNSDLRVLIIKGAGTKAFVAGADIAEMADMNDRKMQ